LRQLAQQAQLSKLSEWAETKKLCLLLHKMRQFQATEDGNYNKNSFLQLLFQAEHHSVIDPKLTFTDETWF
jgi:hypothetical protein